MIDCTPHISLFLSFRTMAAAMQIPALCARPHLCSFRWSLRDEIVERTWRAFDLSSSKQRSHLKSDISVTGTLRKRDGGSSLRCWHNLLHSSSIWFRSSNVTALRSTWCPITAFAMDGRCPQARALPSLDSSFWSKLGDEREDVDTDT